MEKRTRRLGHKKSRNGCQRCKARRVKCDENRPCHRCVAHNTHCSLLDAPPPPPSITAPLTPPTVSSGQYATAVQGSAAGGGIAPSDASLSPAATASAFTSPYAPDPAPHPAASTSASAPDPPDFSEDWLQSLRLMHHYSTSACIDLPQDACTEELWQTAIPEMACSHKFLMHGLLALSALHYAHSHPRERRRWDLVSVHHQNLALRFFATRLADIDKSNCEAYFFLASLIFIVSVYPVAHADLIRDRPVGLGDVAQSCRFLHGVKGILDFQPIDEWRQRGGPLDVLLRQPCISPAVRGAASASAFQKRLDVVTALAREVPATFNEVINEQTVCVLALESLRRSHQVVKSEGAHVGGVWGWCVTLPALFIEMIDNAHPTALVILAHFAALSRMTERGDWACAGWSRGVMLMIDEEIEAEWRAWIEWPKKCLMGEMDVDDMEVADTPV
ncbi:Sterol uptake control protein 2 [Colletotrichum sidae]|uniref:Sterol uptake control protein 2 n=1 Tax=Colletotrichum sidae TaxID=1347389 RepID=A0A4R8TQ83_9PEZI|nr:Sterol uptake control protein 2 [Colletotrichum sidae]